LLVEHGADVNAVNTRGHTLLYCAGGHGHLDCLLALLDEGVDCDAQLALLEWLAQYPDDARFTPIADELRRHTTGA
jgi:ankyrin repeat protein